MAKLIVNERQLEIIVNYIKESENKYIGVLTEEVNKDKELLNEGWKEVVLATAILLGVGLTGHNKALAQNAIKNSEILAQVKKTLESDKIQDVADSLEAAGLKNAMEKLEKNADRLEKNFENISKRKLKIRTSTADGEEELAKKVNQGYAVKDIKTKTDTVSVKGDNLEIYVLTPFEINFGSDNFFVTAGYELTDEAVQAIKDSISSIKDSGGNIIKVHIESSTDTEPIKMGNEKLSQLRANSIKQLVSGLGIDSITDNALHDLGPHLYSTSMSKEERDSAREQTAKYRYVKITIEAEIKHQIPPSDEDNPKEVIEKNTYELVKAIKKPRPSIQIKIGGFKCVKAKKGGGMYDCPKF